MEKIKENREKNRTNPYRKVHKPLVEKKRRDRINMALDEMKELVLQSMRNQHGKKYEKLEKADILEMTVTHLRKTQDLSNDKTDTTRGPENVFQEGFAACADEVSSRLDNIEGVDSVMKTRIREHLINWVRSRAVSPSMEWDSKVQSKRTEQQKNYSVQQDTDKSQSIPSQAHIQRPVNTVPSPCSVLPSYTPGALDLRVSNTPRGRDTNQNQPTKLPPFEVFSRSNQITSFVGNVNGVPTLLYGTVEAPFQLSVGVPVVSTEAGSKPVPARIEKMANTPEKQDLVPKQEICGDNKATIEQEPKREIIKDTSVQVFKPVHFVRPVAVMRQISKPIPLAPSPRSNPMKKVRKSPSAGTTAPSSASQTNESTNSAPARTPTADYFNNPGIQVPTIHDRTREPMQRNNKTWSETAQGKPQLQSKLPKRRSHPFTRSPDDEKENTDPSQPCASTISTGEVWRPW